MILMYKQLRKKLYHENKGEDIQHQKTIEG
jgi:hypothetical protein